MESPATLGGLFENEDRLRHQMYSDYIRYDMCLAM